MIGLILGVDAVARGAGADFAGLESQPKTFTHHGAAVGVGQLPGQGALRRNEGGHGPVDAELHGSRGHGGIDRIVGQGARVVHRLCQDATPEARRRVGGVESKAADLVALEELEKRDVIQFAAGSDGFVGGARNAEIERLLAIRVVPGGDVSADHEGQIVLAQVGGEHGGIHPFFVQNLLFRGPERRVGMRWNGPGADLDRAEFPQRATVRDESAAVAVVAHGLGETGGECLIRHPIRAGLLERLELVEIVAADPPSGFARGVGGVCRDQGAAVEWHRIAIQAGVVGCRCGGERLRLRMSDVLVGHGVRIHACWTDEREDLPGGVGAEFRPVDSVIQSRSLRVFADVEEVIANRVVGAQGGVVEVAQRIVVQQAGLQVAPDFVPADVVQGLLLSAVFVDHPGEEEIEGVPVHGAGGEARFREHFRRVSGHHLGRGGFVGVVEHAERNRQSVGDGVAVQVSLLILLKMVPAGEDHATEAVDERRERTGRSVVKLEEVSRAGIQTPKAAHRGLQFVLIELGIQMCLASARPVAGEQNAAVGSVAGANVIVIRRLIWDAGDDRVFPLAEADDLKELPEIGRRLVGQGTGAHHHAEHGACAVPVNRGFAHRDAVGTLESARNTVAGGSGEVFQRAVRISDVEVAATPRGIGGRLVVAECGSDGGEVETYWNLRDEQDGIGDSRHWRRRWKRRVVGGETGGRRGHGQCGGRSAGVGDGSSSPLTEGNSWIRRIRCDDDLGSRNIASASGAADNREQHRAQTVVGGGHGSGRSRHDQGGGRGGGRGHCGSRPLLERFSGRSGRRAYGDCSSRGVLAATGATGNGEGVGRGWWRRGGGLVHRGDGEVRRWHLNHGGCRRRVGDTGAGPGAEGLSCQHGCGDDHCGAWSVAASPGTAGNRQRRGRTDARDRDHHRGGIGAGAGVVARLRRKRVGAGRHTGPGDGIRCVGA